LDQPQTRKDDFNNMKDEAIDIDDDWGDDWGSDNAGAAIDYNKLDLNKLDDY